MARVRKPKQYEAPRLCGGKRSYIHRHEAEAVKAEQELLVRDLELSIYRCHLCGQWHLTRAKT